MISKIFIKNFEIFAHHGVLPEERLKGNYFRVNLSIEANLYQAAQSDSVHDTINYAVVSQLIQEEMALSSDLLENVCYRISKALFREFLAIEKVNISVEKLRPPMPGKMESVGVEMEFFPKR